MWCIPCLMCMKPRALGLVSNRKGYAFCDMTAHLCHDITTVFFHPPHFIQTVAKASHWAARTLHVACSLLPACTWIASSELKAPIFIMLEWQSRHPHTGKQCICIRDIYYIPEFFVSKKHGPAVILNVTKMATELPSNCRRQINI